MSVQETATELLVSKQTINRWMDEATREPDKKTIGCLLRAKPPLMGYSDIERHLAVMMG